MVAAAKRRHYRLAIKTWQIVKLQLVILNMNRSTPKARMDTILYLNEADVRPLVTMGDILNYCEEAYQN